MASEDRKSALANALGNPLARGDLDAALDAVRAVHQRDPGADDAKRVVEALELLAASTTTTTSPSSEGEEAPLTSELENPEDEESEEA